ncbi:unknown protein [Cronobacter turicensis z3032]|uniref:Uncharacterized protein n=1 Tax=Cronobacter turicensis (strain DSM 18703 / CCUG 55852 / LMG 23827 / z3032) TaxID=693216 RepID=C9XTG3_CROTZ|nr:unknown protein [Cronobacter turicensis z3032]
MNNECFLIREIYISHSYYKVMAGHPKIKQCIKKQKSAENAALFCND